MANNIRSIRRAKGLSQRDVAERVKNFRGKKGVTARWISRLESGRDVVPEHMLEQIAAVLGVPSQMLLKENLKSIPL